MGSKERARLSDKELDSLTLNVVDLTARYVTLNARQRWIISGAFKAMIRGLGL